MILLLFLLMGDPTTALEEIRARFGNRPLPESLAALEQLARSTPATQAGAQAAAWRGALAQQAGDLAGAEVWYRAALLAPDDTDGHRLGERGLGDLDLLRRRYGPARRHFELGAGGATGVLAHELTQKQRLAARLQLRQWWEWSCWGFLAACFGYFAARALRGTGPVRAPTELVYVAPVYLLLVLGGVGRDPLVLRALLIIGGGSIALIALAGAASRRKPPGSRFRWVQACLLTLGNLALFYAVLNRTGLVDSLMTPRA